MNFSEIPLGKVHIVVYIDSQYGVRDETLVSRLDHFNELFYTQLRTGRRFKVGTFVFQGIFTLGFPEISFKFHYRKI